MYPHLPVVFSKIFSFAIIIGPLALCLQKLSFAVAVIKVRLDSRSFEFSGVIFFSRNRLLGNDIKRR